MGLEDQQARVAYVSLVVAAVVTLALVALAVWPRGSLLPWHDTKTFETDAPPSPALR
jgi:hypothetical protein